LISWGLGATAVDPCTLTEETKLDIGLSGSNRGSKQEKRFVNRIFYCI
jgi:hypothetical protein